MASTEPMSVELNYPSHGGLDYRFIGNIQEFLCPLCSKVMRDPTRISCGHLYCRSCLDYYTLKEGQYICRICHQRIEPKSAVLEVNIQNSISNLKVMCQNVQCNWYGFISQIRTHMLKCVFNSKCDVCDEIVEASLFPQHKEICSKQRCQKCDKVFGSRMDQHICGKDKVYCAFKCGALITRDEMAIHEDPSQLNCTSMERSCPYEKCTVRGVLSVLKDHLTRDALQHAFYYKEQVGSFQDQINSISRQQEELRVENTALKKQLLALQQGHYSNKMKLSSFMCKKLPPFPDESWDDFSEPLTISTDSILIWEIKNFKSLFNVANRYTKIYSQPFYTSPTGFKLCCYAQKDDDQIIHIYVQRMEGKFDCIQGNFEVQHIKILILNVKRSRNQVYDFQCEPPSTKDNIGPIELTSFQNILPFIGESGSAILEVHVS